MISSLTAVSCWSMPAAGSAACFGEFSVCMNFLRPSGVCWLVMAQMTVLQLTPAEAEGSGEQF